MEDEGFGMRVWPVSDTRSPCDIADYLSDGRVEVVDVVVVDDVFSNQTGADSAPEEESTSGFYFYNGWPRF